MKCLRFAPKSGLSTVSVAAMKVDSSASYFLRQIAPAALAALEIGGCSAAGETSGARTFKDSDVPFTFHMPADFTKESVDEFDSRGDVVAAAGVDKLDLIAVRRIPTGVRVPSGDVAHTVQGKSVTSRLYALVIGGPRLAGACPRR